MTNSAKARECVLIVDNATNKVKEVRAVGQGGLRCNDHKVYMIEKSAYTKAVEALKIAQVEIARLNMDAPITITQKTGKINLEILETLKELGELTGEGV